MTLTLSDSSDFAYATKKPIDLKYSTCFSDSVFLPNVPLLSAIVSCTFHVKVCVLFQTGALQSGNRAAYSMRFSGGRSQTMQSMTSCSRSSPPASRQDEVKHANGETQALASPSVEETSVS